MEVLQQDNRHEEALDLLLKSAAQGVRSPEVLTALGDEQVRAGKLDEAAGAYREAAHQGAEGSLAVGARREIYASQGKSADALTAYRESLRVKDRAIVHVAMARVHLGPRTARPPRRS